MSKANNMQVGGSHYQELGQGGEQHWDMMWRLFREAWFVGCITKYVLRYRKKNGLQDLLKARHYLDKLIELETAAAAQETQTEAPAPESGKIEDSPPNMSHWRYEGDDGKKHRWGRCDGWWITTDKMGDAAIEAMKEFDRKTPMETQK